MDSTGSNLLKFDLTSRQIKFRDVLSKDYLELEVYAISDINPNRNKSHFTTESLKKAVERGDFKNKPIVGFFEKNDFTTHEGKAGYDFELDKQYWDTTHGERILGWIRESDKVEIVEKDGLNWIKFTCILCTKYCYNQVKRLLRDRRKKVSVEVMVNEAKMEGDIEEILDFTINGTTILGSKNGKEVLEGIPDAHLSILENLDEEALEGQRKVLSFAYEQMETSDPGANKDTILGEEPTAPEENSEGKEDNGQTMEENKNVENQNFAENAVATEAGCEEPEKEAVATEACGGEPAAEACGEGENNSCGEQDSAPEGVHQEGAEGECPGECPAEQANEGCGEDPEDDADDEENELEALKARVAELENKCAEYCGTIAHLEEEAASKCAEFTAMQTRAEEAEAKVFEYKCNELKAYAVSLMSGEKIATESYEAIISKCASGTYASDEEVKKDVAYAVFSARSTSEKRFNSSIEQPIVSSNVEKTPMSRAERIAARNKKN